MTTLTIEVPTRRRSLIDYGVPYRRCRPAPTGMDGTALAAAYGAHRSAAYSMAYRLLGDRAAAEDAVQDTFLKLWKGNAQFDPSRGSMRGLVLTIARHVSLDATRTRSRRQRTENIYCTGETYVTDGPERIAERKDDARHVNNALSKLPDEQRCVIEMAYFAGLSRGQIAEEMRIPVGTVKSRMRLGMRKMASVLRNGSRESGLGGASRLRNRRG
jgi:RNA polymerase sigma-70 factor, ECF subfamily